MMRKAEDLDRTKPLFRFEPLVEPPDGAEEDAWILAFRGRRLLVRVTSDTVRIPSYYDFQRSGIGSIRQQFLGLFDKHPVFSAELPEDAEIGARSDLKFYGLRRMFFQLDEAMIDLVARAVQIVDWDRDHRFCSRCGTATEAQSGERAKRCPACELTQYPRLAPAVIVLIERFDRGVPEVLLARSPHFPPGMFSTLAGFVEPGESLEQTVAREIHEEAGIEIDNIRYFGSQPWPFPQSLMVGFTARYAGGELKIDGEEIVEAQWFNFEALPDIPPKISIARRLIEDFLNRQRKLDELSSTYLKIHP